MATVKISQLPAASDTDYVDGTVFPIVSSVDNTTKKANLSDLRANYLSDVKSASLTIASADVLTLNATPIQFGITVPSGYAIRILAIDGKMVYGTTPYATNGNLNIRCVGANAIQAGFTANQFLFGTVSRAVTGTLTSSSGVTDNQLIDGADIEAYVSTGDPTAGDSDIELEVLYRLIPV